MSLLITLADSVLAIINAATLPLPFSAIRAYVPILHPESEDSADPLATLQVLIMPSQLSMVTLSRRDDDYSYGIDVGIFQRLPSGTLNNDQINVFCDLLMAFVEALGDVLRSELVKAELPARFFGLANSPLYDHGKLDQERIFASLLTLNFKVARSR